MLPAISIGAQSYEFLREKKCFFVDKTGLIKEWWENQDAVTLITRPRRFGKTLNLDMLYCFFSNRYAGRGDLFEGLSIWTEETYRRLQGTMPVIFLSFAGVKGRDYAGVREGMLHILVDLYTRYEFLAEEGFLSEKERAYFESVNMEMSDATAACSINHLSAFLSRYYQKKVLIFLDEYDTPLQEAYVNGYWGDMVAFTRSLFNATFKTNPAMERGLLTGITRTSKESIFSDLNHLAVVTTTSLKYSTRFGFTEEEVFQALDSFGLSGEKEKVKAWYDGFTFGGQSDIYNPWSITGFLKEREYKNYWANSSANGLVNALVRQGSPEIKMVMEELMAGKVLTIELDEEIIFEQLGKKYGAVWSLLLAGGYLKVVSKNFDPEEGVFIYVLELTNREVRIMFRNMIRDWFSGDGVPCNEFVRAMLCDDVKAMNRYMNRVTAETFSFFDTGKRPSETEPERFYHGFVLGLMVELGGRYRITSNRESGFGRYDVMLEPYRQEDPAFVLEFKVYDPEEEDSLADAVRAALMQIEEKAYDTELAARGIGKDRIRHYGFAFEGKKVLIG